MKTSSTWKWWIKQRHNPQLGIYYIAEGRLSNAAAKLCKRSVYGVNDMLPFDTESEYNEALEKLRSSGATVQ